MSLRRLLALLFCLFLFCGCENTALAAETTSDSSMPDSGEIAEMLDFTDLDESLAEIEDFFAEHYGRFDFADFWQQIKSGVFSFSFQSFFQMLLDLLFGDVRESLGMFLQLLVLVLLSALLFNFDHAFANSAASLGQKVVYLALMLTVLQVFVVCGKSAVQAITLMSDFLYAVFPLLLTLFVAMGGVTSVGLFHPLLIFSVTAAINLVHYWILPLIYCNAGLTAAGNLNPEFCLEKLAGILKSVVLWSLTVLFTLFTAVAGIVGLGSASMDGLTMKTAKSAVGMFIPVVGRNLADLLGTLMGTALTLKNCLGIAGILVIVAICLVPALKSLLMALLFQLCGALAEPLGDKRLAAALTGLGNVLILFFAAVTACGVFFFFLLTITLAMGNLNLAMS